MPRSALIRTVAAAFIVLFPTCGPVAAETAPVHAGTRLLRSGPLVVEVGDPQSDQCRWNKGLRFSPVANVLRVQLHRQEFLYSPAGGGSLSFLGGLPMEFDIGQEAFQPDPPGYNEGKSGDPFLKIGVGILRRDGGAYNFSTNYPVVEPARTTATWSGDRVHFIQTLTGTANGYACHLEEEVIVKNDRIIMAYLLRNTGTKTFTTEQYLHNFTTFSGRPVGPNVRLTFPYDIMTSPAVPPWQPPVASRSLSAAALPLVVRIGNAIEYTDRASTAKIWVYKPEGYAGPERFSVEHLAARQRVILEASIPAAYVGVWATDYQVSPEQFLQITLAPGQETRFTRTYTFCIDGFVPQDSTEDGIVEVNDLTALSSAWLSEPGAFLWDPACDVSSPPDDRINLRDLAALAGQWQQPNGLPDPVARWRLDETMGTTLIDDRGQYRGVLRHVSGDGSPWTMGVSGGGLQFDGVDDCVEFETCPAIRGTAPRTMAAWIRLPEKPTANQAILAWGQALPGRYWLLEVDTARKLRFSCGAGFACAAKLVGDGAWHHIAVVLDPLVPGCPRVSDIRLYVDARPQIIYEMSEQPIDTGATDSLTIGASLHPPETGYFHGIIDDVRIYEPVLSPAQIGRIYGELAPPS